ncbi:FAD-dependent oxidoreductase [Paeniglutamicibacter sp. ABSL32-1]|uniref:flavin monoamine oxidase family protein n=1 Tax=Paeniglutamicibacter quisquiliarum TaxID=2849498 RepID=UPI001C2D574F|nr:FAD-dependent oxidoreductase [Paeniglutamicibacter quisquiliarum]MBV1777657.1 FAD-dependent oxidoreductase [Paeniglutamicibacter quisquiliarum]
METHDIVIVGGGPAGIGVAYFLRESGLDVRVVEAASEVGGRTKTVALAGTVANAGALFVYRNTDTHELVEELGLSAVPFRPSTYGIHIDGVTSIAANDDDLVSNLPISPDEKAELRSFMQEVLDEYTDYTVNGSLSADADALGAQTVSSRIAHLSDTVRLIIETAIRGGAVGKTSELSAKYALRYFASYVAREKDNRLFAIDGMQEIPRAMSRHLAEDTVMLSTTVVDVSEDATGTLVKIETEGPGGKSTLLARQVVIAIPAPLVANVCKDLPDWKLRALDTAHTPGSSTLCIVADIQGLPQFKDWSFVTTVGKKFDAIINPVPGGILNENIAQFVCYGNSVGYQPSFPATPELVDGWIEDFLEVAPELRGRIIDVSAHSWLHCFSVLSPSRAGNLPQLQRNVGPLHFIGDYTSSTAGTHGAFSEAKRVADQIRTTVKAT